jgi:hypothetical protein
MRDRLYFETLSRGAYWAALGLAAMTLACAHPGTESEPELLWMSTSGADEAQFVDDTSECLSRSVATVGVDQGAAYVFCMKGRGWEEQVSVGASAPGLSIPAPR